jgi:hypothetical protein
MMGVLHSPQRKAAMLKVPEDRSRFIRGRGDAFLLPLTLIYSAASLLHFLHNAVYLRDYPNLPLWLTAGGVMGAWMIQAGTGLVGYLLYSRVTRAGGLITIAVYAAFGLAGLDHYTVAPVSAHTVAMNLTILLEVATAVGLLVCVALIALSPGQPASPKGG